MNQSNKTNSPEMSTITANDIKRFSDNEIRSLIKKKERTSFHDDNLVSEIAKRLSWSHRQNITDIILNENERLKFFIVSKSKKIFKDISLQKDRTSYCKSKLKE
jgi:hypothetical protein